MKTNLKQCRFRERNPVIQPGIIGTFQINLARYRKKANLTQGELSELTGINYSLIGAYENGRRAPTIRSLESLARGLSVHPFELLKPHRTKET